MLIKVSSYLAIHGHHKNHAVEISIFIRYQCIQFNSENDVMNMFTPTHFLSEFPFKFCMPGHLRKNDFGQLPQCTCDTVESLSKGHIGNQIVPF